MKGITTISVFIFFNSLKCCTISVYEGNYDLIPRKLAFLHLPNSFCCTISVYEGNYDPISAIFSMKSFLSLVALFPFMKGITTQWCKNSNSFL